MSQKSDQQQQFSTVSRPEIVALQHFCPTNVKKSFFETALIGFRRFVQKGTRDRHERAHSGTNEFACQKCNKTFRRQDSLKCHLAKSCTQKEVTNAHKCNICFASYRYKNALMYHRRTVHNNKPPKYRCDVCATTFRDRHILKRHMMIHKASNDRPSFNCSLCSVTFTSKTTLKMHYKAVHLDIKDHECHTCNKRLVPMYLLRLKNLNFKD